MENAQDALPSWARKPIAHKRDSKYWYNSPVIATVIIALLSILFTAYIGFNWRKFIKRKKADVFFHVHCTKCGRKLRYRDSQIDRVGICPLCQKPIRFPKPPEVVKAKTSPWVKIAKIARVVWG